MKFWTWQVRHAQGYRELGLLKEAKAELDSIPKERVREAPVLFERAALAQETGDWKRLTQVGELLCQAHPGESGSWILWAYGARRHESLEAAEKILTEALLRHPNDATIHFNLGCYACKRGDLTTAFRRVTKAIALDGKFKELAAEDDDLEALRQSGLFKT